MTRDVDVMRFNVRIYSDEDEPLYQHLAQYQGESRSRRLRLIMRAGLTAMQQAVVPSDVIPPSAQTNVLSFSQTAKPAAPEAPQLGSLEAFTGLGLAPRSFAFDSGS